MHTLEATYRIVTPMFIGDAEQKATSLRPPSIKGALRFWWRALNWGRCLHEAGNDVNVAIEHLHEEEKRLFGLAAVTKDDQQVGGQGCFLLRVSQEIEKTPIPNAQQGHTYLLGQGLYHFRNGYSRSALAAGKFTVSLAFRPNTTEPDRKTLTDALQMLGLLGGLGSRSRKGLGSIALQSLKVDETAVPVPTNLAELREALCRLVDTQALTPPPYSAFCRNSRISLITGTGDGWKLLGDIGSELQLYRSFGQNEKVGSVSAEKNFADDHDLALAAIKSIVDRHPRRIIFGLPHNYFFSSTKAKVDIGPVHLEKDVWTNTGRNRRASPLLIHIHQFPDNTCAGVFTLLPAQFLPIGERIEIKGKDATSRVEPNVDWKVIRDFLDRFPQREDIW